MARQVLTDLDFNSVARINNLPDAVSAQQPVTLAQLNAVNEGLSWKDSVRVSTASNINLASPGASLDGITMATNDRVLVRGQTLQPANGVYIWNGAATPMTRSPDANTANELESAVVVVEEGTSGGSTFRQQTVNFVLDTGNVVWVAFGTATPPATEATAGIAEIATQAETDTGTDDTRIVTPLKLTNWAGRARKHTVDIGDGSNTSYTVTHNFNTRDVDVAVRRNSGAFDFVIVDTEATTLNTVTVRFASGLAPASNAFRVFVQG
jgi:hypothetical protein